MVLLALRTALRLGSLLRLEWRHVNLKKGEIHIRAEETKNKTDLTIPMHPDVQKLLDGLKRRAARKEKILLPRILASPTGSLPIPRTVARVFSGAVARAKLNPPITFHGLRKIAATRMLQGGADLKTVMAIGGWRDSATLLRAYAAVTEEAKRAAIAKL